MELRHILITIVFKTVIVTSIANSIKIKCTYTDEFYYTRLETHCKAFYKCTSKGVHEVGECKPGLSFDFFTQNCTKTSSDICYDPTCIGKANGVYQDTTQACRRAYFCYAGRVTNIDNCPPKHLHNGQNCVRQHLVPCSGSEQESAPLPATTYSSQATVTVDFVCHNKRDGAHFDPSSGDCTTYIMCKAGQLESQKRCSNQAIFNGKSCVPSVLFQCPYNLQHSSQLMDMCYEKPNGFYSNPHHGCASYLRCMAGKVVEINECPVKHYFDFDLRNCVLDRNVEKRRCYDRGISLDCDGKSDGFYKDLSCESFYYCHSGAYKTEYKCPTGKVFNGLTCLPKSQYMCPKNDGDPFCLTRADGYYKDQNDGCRAYLYCSNGYKITYLCQEGHVFDISTKKCVRLTARSMLQLSCRSDYLCYGKSEGYHVDLRSNCRNYVFCKNNEKITQLTCRDNNIFDGQKCVSPAKYDCPSLYHRQAQCTPAECLNQICRKDGFYPDLYSNCRKYFSCIGGKPSQISCGSGERFNGEICVPADKYRCPTICDQNQSFSSSCPWDD